MRLLQQTLAIVRKDLRVELRTREVLYTATLFALVLVTVFVFSGFSEVALMRDAAPGVLWVSVAFVGTLVFGRTFQREREERAVAGLLMVPGILDALFIGKLVVNVLLLGLVELLLVPAVAMTFRLDLAPILLPLTLVLGLGTVGYATLGTVLAAALASVRLREVILPLVLYPLCLPLLLAGVQATASLVQTGAVPMGWLGVLVAFNLLFLVLARWLFGEALDPRHA
jgi:heme exporter protein CcmB